LLPTPKASDGPNGGPGMRNGRGVADALPAVVCLLPTPRATRGGSGTETSYALGGEIDYDERPQGVVAPGADFGPYTAAITRWSAVLGRQAPPPTEPGTNGRPRLSPRFVEFMMGLPDGWVCDVPGITRTAQLKMLGNGVVWQQALLALSLLDPS
jgi:DNA (cytosine-5)-methyltransferase 1